MVFTLHFSNEFLLKLHILVAQVPRYKNCRFWGYFFSQIVDCLIKDNQWVTTEKSISITQNGYILRECAILGFVEQSLLYKTLYSVSQILLNNFHKSRRNIMCCFSRIKWGYICGMQIPFIQMQSPVFDEAVRAFKFKHFGKKILLKSFCFRGDKPKIL